MILSIKRITKALIRLHGCAVWSAPELFAKNPKDRFSRNEVQIMCSQPLVYYKKATHRGSYTSDHYTPPHPPTPQTLFVVGILLSRCPCMRVCVLYPPQTLFVVGILFARCSCVRVCVRPSVTFCFFNILKSHCWIFIKPCKHVHICQTNTLDKN